MWDTVAPWLSGFSITQEVQFIDVLASSMFLAGFSAFIALLFMPAPYGKHVDSASVLYGPKMPGKVAWVLQELPSFCIPAYYWLAGATGNDAVIREKLTSINSVTVLLALMLLHYFNRTFIFPMRIRGGKPTPFVVFIMAFAFCCWNGYQQGRYLTAYHAHDIQDIYEPHFVLGVVTFLVGLFINIQADTILINLRKPGDVGYKIPRGGMFEMVSGANFFGEILEWCGWALAAWNKPAAAFAFFTACNIGPRGAQHHDFYKKKFDDYPRNRTAVIPFVW